MAQGFPNRLALALLAQRPRPFSGGGLVVPSEGVGGAVPPVGAALAGLGGAAQQMPSGPLPGAVNRNVTSESSAQGGQSVIRNNNQSIVQNGIASRGPAGQAFRVGQVYGRGLRSGGYTYLGGDQWRGAQGRVKTSAGGPPQGPVNRRGRQVSPSDTLAAALLSMQPAVTSDAVKPALPVSPIRY